MKSVNDVTLIPVNESHLKMMMDWRNSEEVAKYMYSQEKITYEKQLAWWKKMQENPLQKYWIIEFNGKLLGVANLENVKPHYRTCSWAFYLGDSSTRGQGIGSKVEYQLMKYVFEEMQYNKLYGEVLAENEKVLRMHEGFGFKREAYFRDHIFKNGRFYDVVGVAMLKSEWEKEKENLYNKVYNDK